MKVQSAHADVGDAKRRNDEPEGRSAQRFTPRPDDVVVSSSIVFLSRALCVDATFVFSARSPIRQQSHVFRTPAHKE